MPKYLPETEAEYRPGQMTKARVNDQLGIAGIVDKEAWWETPLGSLGNRTPEGFYDSDPLAIFLCAKYGITADAESDQGTPQDTYDDTISDEIVNAPLPAAQGPAPEVRADSGIRDTVSADELDALRDEADGHSPNSESRLPDWWT